MKDSFRHKIVGISLVIMFLTTALFNPYILAQEPLDLSNVKFKIVCNDTVSVNERIPIEFVLDYENQFNPDFLELKIPNFETECAKLLFVGKTLTNTSHSIINGNKKTTHKVKWVVSIKTVKEGRFLTPDVILLYKNDTLDISPKSKTIVIKEGADASKLRNDTAKKGSYNTLIRLITVLDKGTINLGDSVLMQIKLQSNQRFSEVRLDTPVEIDDCFYENIETIAAEPINIAVDGVECNEWIVSEYLIIPLKSGIIRIPEIKIKGNCTVQKEETDPFWGSLPKFYNVPFHAKSKEIKLKVK